MFTLYNLVYIISNLFAAYIVYKMMGVFYQREKKSGLLEIFSFFLYYFLNTVIYLTVNIPLLMIGFNLVGYLLLSLNYKASVKQRIFSSVSIFCILLCIESLVLSLTGFLRRPLLYKNDSSSIAEIICIQLIAYIVVLVLQNYKNIKNGNMVPILYWIGMLVIPGASLFIILTLLSAVGLTVIQVFISILFLFLINIISFSSHDKMIASRIEKLEKEIIAQQSEYYRKQLEQIQTSSGIIRSLRHDLLNHILVLQQLAKEKQYQKLEEYIEKLYEHSDIQNTYAESGNITIDSILNFKREEAEQKKIDFQLEIAIPEDWEVDFFDMTVILGNLLDNAIEATCHLNAEKRYIQVRILVEKGILTILVSNSYDGTVLCQEDKIVTKKEDKENHGLGLKNIESTIEKYHGILKKEHAEEMFSVKVTLFME